MLNNNKHAKSTPRVFCDVERKIWENKKGALGESLDNTGALNVEAGDSTFRQVRQS